MILDLVTGKYGLIRAYTMRTLFAFAIAGVLMLREAYGLYASGIEAESSYLLTALLWVNFLLGIFLLAGVFTLAQAIFLAPSRRLREAEPAGTFEDERELFEWDYYLSLGFIGDKDLGTHRMTAMVSREQIIGYLEGLKGKLSVRQWDVLIKQPAVRQIKETRTMILTQRGYAKESEAKEILEPSNESSATTPLPSHPLENVARTGATV